MVAFPEASPSREKTVVVAEAAIIIYAKN